MYQRGIQHVHLKCIYYHYYNIRPTVGNNVFNDVKSILAICLSQKNIQGPSSVMILCSLQNSIHPPEMEINPPKTGCDRLCGRVIIRSYRQSSRVIIIIRSYRQSSHRYPTDVECMICQCVAVYMYVYQVTLEVTSRVFC